MFSTFYPTKRLLVKKQTKLSSDIKTFTQDWERDVTNQLTVTKTALMSCSREERAFYKQKATTLNNVLYLLQGKTPLKKSNSREEIELLKTQLQQVRSDYEKINTNYTLHKTLNADLKIQLNRQFKTTNDLTKENEVLRGEVQNMKDMYSQRLKNCLPVEDLERKKTGVQSLQQATYQTLAATVSNQRQIIQNLRDNLSEAERTLSIRRQEIESMKDRYSHRLENSAFIKDVNIKTTGVPSLQQAAYQTLVATLRDQRNDIAKLRDNLSEAERNLQQAKESFLIKEQELQRKLQTNAEMLESQNAVDARRPNAVIRVLARLYRWLSNHQIIGTMWVWMLTMLRICFWHDGR